MLRQTVADFSRLLRCSSASGDALGRFAPMLESSLRGDASVFCTFMMSSVSRRAGTMSRPFGDFRHGERSEQEVTWPTLRATFHVPEEQQELHSRKPKGRAKTKSTRRVTVVQAAGNADPEERRREEALAQRDKWRKSSWGGEVRESHQGRKEDMFEDDFGGAAMEMNRDAPRRNSERPVRFRRSEERPEKFISSDGANTRTHHGLPQDKSEEALREPLRSSSNLRSQKRAGTKKDDTAEQPKTALDAVRRMRAARRNGEEASRENADSAQEKETSGPAGSAPATGKIRRREGQPTDSKGFKTYRHLVPDWDRMTADDVVSYLKKKIVFDEHGIVALDKPYGLSVHGGPKIHHSVAKYLPALEEHLVGSGERLHMIHRIDKETTGVLLLARDPRLAAKLNDMFVNRTIQKEYWALTKGVPDPVYGMIDIPIGDSRATGINRRVLRPYRTEETRLISNRTRAKSDRAITEYKALGATGSCALIELKPRTGVQHQVRLHLANGLCCPILGDHKYSHFSKLAPQRLTRDALTMLKMRQAKVRTLPLCLHAKTLVIPELLGARNVFISAELPYHFKHLMNLLKIERGVFA